MKVYTQLQRKERGFVNLEGLNAIISLIKLFIFQNTETSKNIDRLNDIENFGLNKL